VRRIQHSVWVFCVSLAGCGSPSPAANPAPDSPPPAATAFDPARCGEVTGRVTWDGPVPDASTFPFGVAAEGGSFVLKPMPNPHRLTVDAATKGVAGAVVWLKGIDAARAKPWDLPAVRVELRNLQIEVKQGDAATRTGFVRRGDAVEMASAESDFHVLRGRGAGYFSLAFPDPNKPLSRTFDKAGRVDLSSGAGYYWASASLFVDDHPYYALTDREGRFRFEKVPAGAVTVVAWHPNWNAAKQERDPETGLVSRQTYAAPLEGSAAVNVEVGRGATAELLFR
jgi:hypothetical protein